MNKIKSLLQKRHQPVKNTSLKEESSSLIEKIRDIDRRVKRRDQMSNKQYQNLIDEIFREYGVIIQANTVDYNKEIISLAGSPLKSGSIEYLKTTPAGYDHFIIYHARDYKNPAGLDALKAVCEEFGLHFNKKTNQIIRLMQPSPSKTPLVAEMFGKGFRHKNKSKQGIVLPYEILGVNKEYGSEEKLIKALAREVYHVSI